MGVGASSWLEWSSGRDGGSFVPDQALLDAQVPGGPAPALNDPRCQHGRRRPPHWDGAGADCVEPEKGSYGARGPVGLRRLGG